MKKIGIKSDCKGFQSFLEELREQAWLTAEQRWWTHHLFHFTEIKNAVSILKSNELLCRTEAEKGEDFFHGTSADVLEHTKQRYKDCVRFYFRPRTPTAFHVEGFRTSESLKRGPFPGAHCPIPVYFLFDLENIICREDCSFTYGSAARSSTADFTSAKDFRKMPFQLIYHNAKFQSHEHDKIIFHRHAEVFIPKRLNLDNLQYIWCRSQAEYETLRNLLPFEVWQRWRERVVTRTDHNLFDRRRVYVNDVFLTGEQIHFEFNPTYMEEDRGPFEAKVTIYDNFTGKDYSWSEDAWRLPSSNELILDLSNVGPLEDYNVVLRLDGNLAYKNHYQSFDIPF